MIVTYLVFYSDKIYFYFLKFMFLNNYFAIE